MQAIPKHKYRRASKYSTSFSKVVGVPHGLTVCGCANTASIDILTSQTCTSVAVLAEISVSSSRKLFIFIIYKK